MNAVEVLKAAKAHISDPAMWYRGDFFAGHEGKALIAFETFPDVACCVYGAVAFVSRSAVSGARSYLEEAGDGDVAGYNDAPDTTHADIMALFDSAIELAAREAGQ